MAEFAYNNAKYASMGHKFFELNYGYHLRVSYKNGVESHSKSKVADELTKELRNLMAEYRENLQHAQKPQKRAYDKGIKPRSYASGKKV